MIRETSPLAVLTHWIRDTFLSTYQNTDTERTRETPQVGVFQRPQGSGYILLQNKGHIPGQSRHTQGIRGDPRHSKHIWGICETSEVSVIRETSKFMVDTTQELVITNLQ